jgi:hypothetical protein
MKHFPQAALSALSLALFQPSFAATPGLSCGQQHCTLTVTDSLSFEASADAVYDGPAGVEINGDVTVHTSARSLTLMQAQLVFRYRDDNPDVPFELYGTAIPPMAELPLFDQASFHAQPMAAVGLVGRSTLKSLLEDQDYRLPLAENPKDPDGDPNDLIDPAYLFFHVETGLSLDLPLGAWIGLSQEEGAHDPFAFSVPGDKSVTFILDPTEPYFFLSQDARAMLVDKLEESYQQASDHAEALEEQRRAEEQDTQVAASNSNEPNQDDGRSETSRSPDQDGTDSEEDGDSVLPELGEIAFSWLGGIPFVPDTTWGLPAGVGRFKGHLYLDATVPLYKFVELTGTVVTQTSEEGFEQGGNGDVEVSFELIPNLLSFSFPLGNASAGVRVMEDDVVTYFSGIQSPDLSFLPPIIPIVPSNGTQVAGYISSEHPQDSRLMARGNFGYDMSGFRSLTGLDLNDLMLSQAEMTISAGGVWVQGRTGASIHPSISLGGEARVELFFSPQNPVDSYVEMSGEMLIAGVGLKPVLLRLDRYGLVLEGAFVTPVSEIAMVGQITGNGPSMTGSTSIGLSFGDLRATIEAARAGVVKAQEEVERLTGVIEHNRSIVRAEREEEAQRLADAQADVTRAQNALNILTSGISSHYKAISTYRSQISAKYRWYKRQHWTKRAWAWVRYTAYKAGKKAQIAWRYTQIASLKIAQGTAKVTLDLAKLVLRGLEESKTLIPVDLDPRVAGPLVALETARTALTVAEAVLPELPDVDARIAGVIELTLDHRGLRGNLSVDSNGLQLAGGRVNFGRNPEACIDVAKLGAICAPF